MKMEKGYLEAKAFKNCSHKGEFVYESKDGIKLYGGARRNMHNLNKFQAYINLTGDALDYKENDFIFGKEMWSSLVEMAKIEVNELVIDWTDGGIIPVSLDFWKKFWDILKENKLTEVVFFCIGGHGRTGTALASMMIADGINPFVAIQVIRKDYCDKAIETDIQERYLKSLLGE